MYTKKLPKALTEELVIQRSGDELLIYDLRSNRAVCLNQTASLVWENCTGSQSISEIALKLSGLLDTPVDEELVVFALDQLANEGLLSDQSAFYSNYSGESRRQVIKKLGFGSLVALPIVSAIIAPQAALAGSGGCVNPGGALPGTPGNNPEICIGPLAACQTTGCGMGNPASPFLLGCCSGMSTISPIGGTGGGVCNSCTCICA